ncbi:hypothetical protein DENSPDRAFT_861022 [Dentipellis sp. KUC8613]|nr:hypothetical protein DENSPDRAFT_861022 [Dentipellis sp. KUC8613]
MAPRRLSAEEKHRKLVEIFHESLKELEKMKGISTTHNTHGPKTPVCQSIQEVLQSLVDDGLVQTDKVGSSNCKLSFLSFMQNRVDAAREAQKPSQQQLLKLRASIDAERASRPESTARHLAKLVQHKKELQALETELQAYDTEKRAVILAEEAAVQWTGAQSGVETDDVRKYLGVGENYEDIC